MIRLLLVMLMLFSDATIYAMTFKELKKPFKESVQEKTKEESPCYLAHLPNEVLSQIVLWSCINDFKENSQNLDKKYYFWMGKLYKKGRPSLIPYLASNGVQLWQDPKYAFQLILAPSYSLLAAQQKGLIIKKCIPNVKAPGLNIQKIIMSNKRISYEEVVLQKLFEGEVSLAAHSDDGKSFYTLEQNSSNAILKEQCIVIRTKEDNEWKVAKKIDLDVSNRYTAMTYVDSFHLLGLLTPKGVVKLIAPTDEFPDFSKPHISEYFASKRVCKQFSSLCTLTAQEEPQTKPKTLPRFHVPGNIN